MSRERKKGKERDFPFSFLVLPLVWRRKKKRNDMFGWLL